MTLWNSREKRHTTREGLAAWCQVARSLRLAFAGCAAFLVGGCAGVSTACDPAPVERLPIRQLGYGCIRAIAFSDDARRAATGTTDGTVRVWDLRSLPAKSESRAEGTGPFL